MIVENISVLKIHYMTQEQYDREKTNGALDENALYLTPEGESITRDELEKALKELKVDSELSNESTNPVQNKIIASKIENLETKIDNTIGNIAVMLSTI